MALDAENCNNLYETQIKPIEIIDTTDEKRKFLNLRYTPFKDNKHILILGEKGIVTFEILGKICSYFITNPNLKSQEGLFIMNTTYDKPTEKIIRDFLGRNKFAITCLNINKSLRKRVIDEILTPMGICEETIYPQNVNTINIRQWLTTMGL